MKQKDIEVLLQRVNKKSSNNNIWFTSITMTNAYLEKFFNGTEHDLLKKKYAKYLFAYILEFLNDSKNLKGGNFTPNVLEEFISDIRRCTFELRRRKLWKWINGVTGNKSSDDDLTQSLITFFPSLDKLKEVKQQLGLNYVIN